MVEQVEAATDAAALAHPREVAARLARYCVIALSFTRPISMAADGLAMPRSGAAP
jgi:hypothetical protein